MESARIALIGCGAPAATVVVALRHLSLRPALFIDADLAAAQRLARGAPVAAAPRQALDRFDAAIVTGVGTGCTAALHELAEARKNVLCAPEALAAAACADPRFVACPSIFAP